MPGLIRGVARTAVVAGTASAVAGRVNRHQQQKWSQQDQGAAEQQSAPPQEQYAAPPTPAAPAAPAPDRMAQLKELGELHAQGILTDEEFAVEKSKILNS